MASVLEKLQVKYKGLQIDVNSQEKKTTITYQGSKDLCNEALQEIYQINVSDPTYGNIENVRMFCADGPIWNLEVTYSIDKSGTGLGSSNGSTYGPKSSELSMSMLSLPLEGRDNYLMNWNNNLYSTLSSASIPDFYYVADYEDDGIDGTKYEYPRRINIRTNSFFSLLCMGKE